MDDDSVPNIRKLVTCHLKDPPRLAASMRLEAELVRVDGAHKIYVRAGTTATRARFLAAHELAHWWLHVTKQEDPWILEDQANALGAILCAPGRLVSRVVRAVGDDDPIWIAKAIETTQSLALLRLGETQRRPAALVTPKRCHVRGCGYAWPTEAQLRRLAYTDLARHCHYVTITDEPHRVGLLANTGIITECEYAEKYC